MRRRKCVQGKLNRAPRRKWKCGTSGRSILSAGVESSLLNSTTSWQDPALASHLLRPATVRRGKLEGVQTILEMALPVTLSGCDGPRVAMVEPTHPRQCYKSAVTHFPSLYRPRLGRVLPQSIVDPIRMIQVISTTPILGSVEKSAIRGIRGTAVKCGCIPRS